MSVDLGRVLEPSQLEHQNGASFLALLDTGAKRTSVDIAVADNLGLGVEMWIDVVTAAGVDRMPLYEKAMIHLPSIGELRTLNLVGARLRPDHMHDVLIGRDILADYQMIYDGRTGRVTLSDEAPRHSAFREVGVGRLEGPGSSLPS